MHCCGSMQSSTPSYGSLDVFISLFVWIQRDKGVGEYMCLKVKNLIFSYIKGKNVLAGADFEAEKGKVSAILGVNGAGKTTLLNILAGIYTSYGGEVFVDGELISKKNVMKIKRKFFFIGDEPILFEEMTALQFIKYIHAIYKKNLDYGRLTQLSQKFQFEKYLCIDCGKLSLGNRQKALIITALLLQCEILILDEPLVGLDVMAIEIFYDEIRSYAGDGRIVIFSTHIIEVVSNACDNVFVLDKGRIRDSFEVTDEIDIKSKFFEVLNYAGDI